MSYCWYQEITKKYAMELSKETHYSHDHNKSDFNCSFIILFRQVDMIHKSQKQHLYLVCPPRALYRACTRRGILDTRLVSFLSGIACQQSTTAWVSSATLVGGYLACSVHVKFPTTYVLWDSYPATWQASPCARCPHSGWIPEHVELCVQVCCRSGTQSWPGSVP